MYSIEDIRRMSPFEDIRYVFARSLGVVCPVWMSRLSPQCGGECDDIAVAALWSREGGQVLCVA